MLVAGVQVNVLNPVQLLADVAVAGPTNPYLHRKQNKPDPPRERQFTIGRRPSKSGPLSEIDVEAQRQALERRIDAHAELLDDIARAARDAGLRYCETSYIDLVVGRKLIIEAKSVDEDAVAQVRAALGQLYYYRFHYRNKYPKATLVAAFNRRIDYTLRAFLQSCGIVPVWQHYGRFESDRPVPKQLSWLINVASGSQSR